MPLALYRRHRLNCKGKHPHNSRTSEYDERKKNWRRCECPIFVSGTLGRDFRQNTGRWQRDEATAVARKIEKTEKWEGESSSGPSQQPPDLSLPPRVTFDRAIKAFTAEFEEHAAHNPDRELRKVVQAIEVAQTVSPARPNPPACAEQTESMAPPPLLAPTRSTQSLSVVSHRCAQVHLQLGDVDMHLVSRTQLADLLAQVVNVESPVHWMEAARRVLDGAGIHRLGNGIQEAFEQAVRVGVDRKLFVKREEFLWGPAMQQPPIRNRSELPAASRKLEFVAPEEIRRAVLIVVQES